MRQVSILIAALASAAHGATQNAQAKKANPLIEGEYQLALEVFDALRQKLDATRDPAAARRVIDEMCRALPDIRRALWNRQRAFEEVARLRETLRFEPGPELAEKSWRAAWRGEELAVLRFRGRVRFLDGNLAEKKDSGSGFGQNTTHFAFGPRDETFAFNDPHEVTIKHRKSGREVRIETASDQSGMTYSPDGRRLVTTGYGHEAHMWSVADGKHVRTFTVQGTEGGLTAAFSPDGRVLAIGNRNHRTHLFAADTGEELHVLGRLMSHQLAFSPDGRSLAVAYVDGKVGIWSTRTGALTKLLDGEAKEVFAVQWSPDGRLLVTAGHDGKVLVWSGKHLARICALDPGSDRVFRLVFRPDGKMLVAAGNKVTRSWRIREGG